MSKSLKTNFLYQSFYQVLILGIPLVLSPFLTRTLGSESLGTYSYCYSIANYFTIFIMLGLLTHGCRKIAACQNDEEERVTFYTLFFFHLFVSAIVLVLYGSFVFLFGNDYRTIYLLLFFYLLSCVFDVTWYYYGKENFKSVVIKNSVIKIVETALIFAFIRQPSDLIWYVLIVCISIFVGQMLLLPPILKKHKIYRPKFSDLKPHIVPLLFLTLSVIAINVYTILDKTFIGIFVKDNNSSVAFYDYSEKIAKLPITILNVLGAVLLPKMSSLHAKGNAEEMKKIIHGANVLLSCLACGACFGLMAISRIVMPIYYGDDFAICGDYLLYLCPLIIVIPFGASIRNSFLIPSGRDKEYLISLVVAAIINLTLNLILIPNIGVIGAIIGTICSEIVACALQFFFVRKELPIWKYFLELLPFVALGALMFFGIMLLNNYLSNTLITVLIDVAVGASFYLIFAGVYLLTTHRWIFNSLFARRKVNENSCSSTDEVEQ